MLVQLTLDVLEPPQGANGTGIIAVVSGAWISCKVDLDPRFFNSFLKRGYTVFGVVHGSQPTFTSRPGGADHLTNPGG